MIFLWGRRNKVLEAYSDERFKCEVCESNHLIYTVSQNYFHLFWIPIVPNNKFVGTYCPDCLETKEIVYGEHCLQLEKQTKSPIYMYSLLILFGILVLYVIVNSIHYNKKQKELIKNPIKEDVYTIKITNETIKEAYSFVKVIGISKDSIFLIPADSYFNREIGYLRSNVSFKNDTIRKSRNDLISMYNSDNITEIYRSKH